MKTEQGIYAKVKILRRKELKLLQQIRTKMNLNSSSKVNLQDHNVFYLEFDLIEVNFSTFEPDFYKTLFQSHEDTQGNNTFKYFQVPIGNSKCVESFKFQNDAQILKYFQKSLSSCCFQ